MKKILVTTDLSNNSKAGLYFAIQLASQYKFELTFFHVYNILIPSAWHVLRAEEYEKTETKMMQKKLNLFVASLYKKMDLPIATNNCVVKSSLISQSAIMEYAEENNFNFICMSTRGAGIMKRFFGTNTSNIINNSAVPVIAVPHNYKATKISSILYASDLVNLEKELKNVVDFAKPLKASVELLHFTSPIEKIIDPKILEITLNKLSKYNIKMNIKDTDYVESMIVNIEKAIKKTKPSLMIMFTEQNRTLFQKLFLSSTSAEYSFNSKIPILVFNKSMD